jgi:hypothetical protein
MSVRAYKIHRGIHHHLYRISSGRLSLNHITGFEQGTVGPGNTVVYSNNLHHNKVTPDNAVNMTQKVSPLLNRGNRSRRVPIWLTTLP